MTLLGGFITTILALLVLCQSRTVAALSIIAAVCYITEGQSVEVAGFRFTAIRIVLSIGLVRVVARGELRQLRLGSVDWTLVLSVLSVLVISTLRVGTVEEFIYRMGMFANALLAYFVFASLLREQQDFHVLLSKIGLLIVPFAVLMVLESLTGKNAFAVLGGVWTDSWIRDGHVRSAGAFRNPITAGSFGACLALLFASALFAFGRSRTAVIGLSCSILIVVCARSSGPFLGLVLGFLAFGCWPLRRNLRTLRWGVAAILVGLALVMKAPVWFLFDRVSDIIGGGGYHRALLIDRLVNSFSSWWLAGTSDTAGWFPYTLPDGTADMTNRFVLDAVDAGLIGMILSVALVARSFQRLGAAMKAVRAVEPRIERFLWGIGSTLVGNVGILLSVTYFDQMFVMWYFLLAYIGRVDVSSGLAEASVRRAVPAYGVSRAFKYRPPRTGRNASLRSTRTPR